MRALLTARGIGEAVVVPIGRSRYLFSPLPDGATEVRKLGADPARYVIREGRCSCPGFRYRHSCRHAEAWRRLACKEAALDAPATEEAHRVRVEDLDPERRTEFEERASIMQFDGGLSRDRAEALALAEIVRGRHDR